MSKAQVYWTIKYWQLRTANQIWHNPIKIAFWKWWNPMWKNSAERSEEWVFTCSGVMALWKRFPVSTYQARSSSVFENETVLKQTLYHLICGGFVRQLWTIILPTVTQPIICACVWGWYVCVMPCECIYTITSLSTIMHAHLCAWGIVCARTGWCFDWLGGVFAYSWEENHLWFDECWQKGLLDMSWHS